MLKLQITTRNINQFLLCALAALMIFTPFYPYQKMIFILGLFMLWLCSALAIDGGFLHREVSFVFFLVAFVLLDLFRGLISNSTVTMLEGINRMPTFIWAFIFQFYKNRIGMLRKPLVFIIAMIVVSSLYTLFGNLQYPEASRLLANVLQYYENQRNLYRSLNIGGYGFIFSLAFLSAPLCLLAKVKDNKRVSLIAIVILLVATVFVASYFTAIIFMCILLFMSLGKKKNLRNSFVAAITLVMVVVFFSDEILKLLVTIAENINSEILAKRATQLLTGEYFMMNEGDSNRIVIYLGALQNWIQRPLFGELQGGTIVAYRSGHSALLGYLEQYGMLSVIYYAFYYQFYKSTLKLIKIGQIKTQFKIYYICFMGLLLIDIFNTFCDLGMTILFLAPALYLLYDDACSKKRRAVSSDIGVGSGE